MPSFVPLFPITNPFALKTVYIKGSFTNNIPIPIDTLNNSHIMLKNGVHTYQYVVDGIPKCIPTKLTLIDEKGNERHYIEVFDGRYHTAWLKLSISIGDTDALYILGRQSGRVGDMKHILSDVAKCGHVPAMMRLAEQFQKENNYIEAARYWNMAADNGCSAAMIELAEYYLFKLKNYDEAKRYYLMAINLGNSDAMYGLGEYYLTYECNIDKMRLYWEMAASLDNFKAIRALDKINPPKKLSCCCIT